MALDYANFQALAKRLIDENGRAIVLVQSSRTPANGAQPWRAPTFPASGTGATEVTATGVFLAYKESDIPGQLVKRGEKRCLVAVTDLAPLTDIRQFDAVRDVDDDETWRILDAQLIHPGDTRILYDLRISQ